MSGTKRKTKTGFTLIETIIAIFILLVGIVGSYNATQDISFSSNQTRQRLIAAYLAQEATEIVKNQRDTNFRRNAGWNAELNIGAYQPQYDTVSFLAENINITAKLESECPLAELANAPSENCYKEIYESSDISFLALNAANQYVYDNAAGQRTIFKRFVVISASSVSAPALVINTYVLWKAKDRVASLRVTSEIYNWARK